jgi:hypothetical protein
MAPIAAWSGPPPKNFSVPYRVGIPGGAAIPFSTGVPYS